MENDVTDKIEGWLISLGARIDLRHYATWEDLRIRYTDTYVQIAWDPTFDRWANSIDWRAEPPTSCDALASVLMQARALGAAGDLNKKHNFQPTFLRP